MSKIALAPTEYRSTNTRYGATALPKVTIPDTRDVLEPVSSGDDILEDHEIGTPTVAKVLVRKKRLEQNHTHKFNHDAYVTIHEWYGEIVEQNDDCFVARIHPTERFGNSASSEEDRNSKQDFIEFKYEEVHPDERSFITTGAFFKWHIGYRRTRKRQIINEDKIVFRTFPVWNKAYKNKLELSTSELEAILFPSHGSSTS
jgi:hypothetical protein